MVSNFSLRFLPLLMGRMRRSVGWAMGQPWTDKIIPRSHNARFLWGGLLTLLTACQSAPPRSITIQQGWELQIGHQVGDYSISSGLGDITLELGGDAVQMPFDGKLQPMGNGCVAITSSEVPAYLFRLCGIHRPAGGVRPQGHTIGRAKQLVFAALRKQPDGTWTLVEPATDLIEQFLSE